MSGSMFTRYGMMYNEDADVLDGAFLALLPKARMKVLEIGTYSGDTARGMKKFLEERGCEIEYWGIDPGLLVPVPDPFAGARVIKGRSEECFHLVPNDFDFIFVDGNHSRNAVILDVYNYHSKVVPGGFMVFHDTNPLGEGVGYEYFGPNTPQFGISVLEAFRMIKWPWPGWTLVDSKYPAEMDRNGATSYRLDP